ncbi:hypothetical protein ASF06_00490 [Agreia sp. Leaf244]|uniref:hypothetical protein n=1 Tax=unclassified Agreia TaxID=2641148 RepID=UPI0006FCF7E9|nr:MULTISPECIES: hypothetical protein [unclassified Agreia]KQO11193.1 hypothetical protein ASF06_00490 [Agreia sp. Leaf244]KQP56455.1 hypothetical protein ASF51_00500 [Agreia sp. Leaf283]
MSIHAGTPWRNAGSWRGDEPRRAIRAWLLASGLGGLMLAALLLAPPVSPPASSIDTPAVDTPAVVVTTR